MTRHRTFFSTGVAPGQDSRNRLAQFPSSPFEAIEMARKITDDKCSPPVLESASAASMSGARRCRGWLFHHDGEQANRDEQHSLRCATISIGRARPSFRRRVSTTLHSANRATHRIVVIVAGYRNEKSNALKIPVTATLISKCILAYQSFGLLGDCSSCLFELRCCRIFQHV
jgi:hypothetical protein